jgi:hypothetical protein
MSRRRSRQAPSDGQPGLSFQDRNVAERLCDGCGGNYDFVTGYILKSGDAYAIYYVSCSGHRDEPRVNLDAIFGTWIADAWTDRVTFSCQIRPEGAGCMDAPVALSQPVEAMGVPLTRQLALAHPRVAEFWQVVDFICLHDPAVMKELAGGAGR